MVIHGFLCKHLKNQASALTALLNAAIECCMCESFWVCVCTYTLYNCTQWNPSRLNIRLHAVEDRCGHMWVYVWLWLSRGNVMKAMAPLGLSSCRTPSYHSQWRERETERERRERWKCQRLQWNLTSWHIKSCRADRVKGEREGGIFWGKWEINRNDSQGEKGEN